MTEVFGWLLLVSLLLAAGVVAGIHVADQLTRHRTRSLDEREAKLQADWHALMTAQRLNAAFMDARKAMWEEAVRHGPPRKSAQ